MYVDYFMFVVGFVGFDEDVVCFGEILGIFFINGGVYFSFGICNCILLLFGLCYIEIVEVFDYLVVEKVVFG